MHKNETTKKELSAKKDMFCREYMVDLNATQAAIRAGYSHKTAGAIGFELLKKPEIIIRLSDLAKEKTKKSDITAQYVLDGIKAIAEDEDARQNDRLKAYELLGKYLKLFVDRQEVEHKATITLIQLQDIRQQ